MSNGLARDYYTSVIEFICNGYDSSANNFSITASLDKLVMEDDGSGMDRESIHNFFTKGTDYKRLNPRTREGRKRLGRFGLATLLLRHLGDAYVLETWKDGEKIIVEQDFARDGWRNSEAQIVKSNEQSPHGTRINITKPRYELGSPVFSLDKLKSEITWGFPPFPDFKITLNGQEVPKRAAVVNGVEYDASAQITGKVRISGSIFYNNSRTKGERSFVAAGINLYANGRRTGDPQDFGLSGVEAGLQGNVLGLIEIYGLDDRIRFDRSAFLKTPEFHKIREHILRVLQSIAKDLDHGIGKKEYYRAERQVNYINQALKLANQRLNSRLKPENGVNYTLVFDTGENSGPIAAFDPQTSVIYINQSNPQLVRRPASNTIITDLETTLLMSAIIALAEHESGQANGRGAFNYLDQQIVDASARLFTNYTSIRADLRSVTGTDDVTPIDKLYINPFRMYDIVDLVQLTGWDSSTIKVLSLSNIPEGEMHGSVVNVRKFKGDKVAATFPKLEGHVASGKLVDPQYWGSDWRYNYNFDVDRKLEPHVGRIPFITNAGTLQPFVLVKTGYEQPFLEFWNRIREK